MAKQKGLIKIHGTLNGISYYPLGGQYISRIATGPSKERIQTDPAYAKVRANNLEFGMASRLSKAIRTGILETAKEFQDSTMASRLTGVCYKIIKEGSGSPGKREASLTNNPKALKGFQLNQKQSFEQIYTAKPIVTSHKNRRIITLSIPKSSKIHLEKKPKTATHFQLIAALSLVSNYKCRPNQKSYRPVAPKHNGLGITQKSEPLLCKIEHTNLQIQLKTPVKTAVSKHATLIVWFGIQFLKQEKKQFHLLKNRQVMHCITLL
ncbi:hypothetical protein OS188_09070 [Xanthomarina sp. F1114]|uniref:hypothetical protein n=1 Tax=Xanthomarina sp. F1114 TaxID=2996019 RepID=UPI00225E4C88|nr:hypothetical protein [Xanthomarina sp. F1114]MCX7548102.1 hypothetical protein [Xanthomarina sp. F1114]